MSRPAPRPEAIATLPTSVTATLPKSAAATLPKSAAATPPKPAAALPTELRAARQAGAASSALAGTARAPGPAPGPASASTPTISAAAFAAIAALLHARSGLALGPDKGYLLETRLMPIARRLGLSGLDALADRLGRGDPALVSEVVEAMTTNESLFFRDDKPFAHVRTEALPRLHAARPPGVPLRLWSAAASTGQEAYSLAMILADLESLLGRRPVEIVGTDIATEQLARAREGLFTQFEVQRGLPMQMLVKHFRKDGNAWRVSDRLRGMVSFREWNLLADLRPLGRFDIVFCRNVLIYFDAATKTRALASVARQMAPDGLLYLGGAETVLGVSTCFVPLEGQRGVYRLADTLGPPTPA